MPFSDSNSVALRFQRETVFNTKPSPFNSQALRFTSSSLAAERQTAISDEIRADRMVSDSVEVGFSSGGQIGFELSLGGSFDSLIEAALCGAYSTAVNFTGAITVAAAGKTLTATGAFTNASVGQMLFLSGMTNAANNGWHKITAKASNDSVTVATTTLVNETSAASAKVKSKQLKNGIAEYSYAIEQAFTDINVFQLFTGQAVSQMTLEAKANSKVSGNFQFMGAAVATATATTTSAIAAATTTPVVNATSNVSQLMVDGAAALGSVVGLSLQVNNNLRNQMAVGSKYPASLGWGRQQVSGTLTVYFNDKVLYDKFLAGTYISAGLGLQDALGNGLYIELPKISINKNDPTPGGMDQDVLQALDFVALADATSGAQIIVTIA